MKIFKKETKKVTVVEHTTTESKDKKWQDMAPKKVGMLDMVIAFDTTGSMAAYIEDVRKQVAELIPKLFKDNEDLKLGIVAFGDYCDMNGKYEFGDAYQYLPLTNNENDIIKFIRNTKDTSGGDGDEFYELVIKKIVEETAWREGSTRSILLISDADPHPLGYTYKDYVVNNQIDWRKEAQKAANEKIKIDTVTITDEPWYKELSKMTNGVSVPFSTSGHTSDVIMASTMARGSFKARRKFDKMRHDFAGDSEMSGVFDAYAPERDDI